MSGVNRVRTRRDKRNKGERRKEHGEELLREDNIKKQFDNDWNLDWFQPKGLQIDCVEAIEKNIFTIIDGSSGCGKTSTALWWALHQIKNQNYNHLVFIKNATEVGDDAIGYLSGDEKSKVDAHMDATKRIFWEFMSKNKLENDISKGKIRLTIPNFLLGTTMSNSVVILDECQLMSPATIKLLTERCGPHTKYIILGDSTGQRYAVKNRADGLSDFIKRVTVEHHGLKWSKYEPFVGYVKMNQYDNQRSEGSKFINKLYEEE